MPLPNPPRRAARLSALRSTYFDLLVVGGGITGCGIARDAALRGHTVALIDKDDFASGTSSRSSRLIHGGLRYLEHGYLHLVFESSSERRTLLRIAPHLVRPLEFLWPIYQGARLPRWKVSAGMALYDALSLFRNVGMHRQMGRDAVTRRERTLLGDGLTGGMRYFDAATDDARLTLANALSASEAGATVVNHLRLDLLTAMDASATGGRGVDVLTGDPVEIRARVIVNAAGPWSDSVRRMAGEAIAKSSVQGSKGAHIAVPRARIGNRRALTLLHPEDGRVFFVLPAGPAAIIGTTDTFTDVSADVVRATEDDVRYLLVAANHYFPAAALEKTDVLSAWAGIRPLLPSAGDGPGSASREHAIVRSDDGTITITGGKLTTYRRMAAEVVDQVQRQLGLRPLPTQTDAQPLPGGDLRGTLDDELAMARIALDDDATRAEQLVHAYGSRWREVDALCRSSKAMGAKVAAGLGYQMGEMAWAVEHEMAETLGDLLIRRTHVAFETADHGVVAAAKVVKVVAPLLGWSEEQCVAQLAAYVAEVDRIFTIEGAKVRKRRGPRKKAAVEGVVPETESGDEAEGPSSPDAGFMPDDRQHWR